MSKLVRRIVHGKDVLTRATAHFSNAVKIIVNGKLMNAATECIETLDIVGIESEGLRTSPLPPCMGWTSLCFLKTWNCRHIANAEMEPYLREVCERHGWRCPVICTPEQLLPPAEGETT